MDPFAVVAESRRPLPPREMKTTPDRLVDISASRREGPPAVSVVIPAYNAVAFIAEALDSVAAQTRSPLEVIVVDDGSRDGTGEAVSAWRSAKNPSFRLILITQENRGLPGARNVGIRRAEGRWIALLDADDIWSPAHLAALLDAVALPGSAIAAYGDGHVFEEGLRNPRLYEDFWDRPSHRLGKPIDGDANGRMRIDFSAFERLVKGNFIKPSSLLFGREEAMAIGLFDESLRYAEDREFLVRLLRTGDFVFVPEAITDYRWHADNATHDKNAKRNSAQGLRALRLIMRNADLRLSTAEHSACVRAVHAGAADYLYLSAREGLGSYAAALLHLKREMGLVAGLQAFRVRHLAAALLPR